MTVQMKYAPLTMRELYAPFHGYCPSCDRRLLMGVYQFGGNEARLLMKCPHGDYMEDVPADEYAEELP